MRILKVWAIVLVAAICGMGFILLTTDAYSLSSKYHIGEFMGAVFATFVAGWLVAMLTQLVRRRATDPYPGALAGITTVVIWTWLVYGAIMQ